MRKLKVMEQMYLYLRIFRFSK